jgi:adiponectin receptor
MGRKKIRKNSVADEKIAPFIGYKSHVDKNDDYCQTKLIESGWRINFDSYPKAFGTFFMLHNETVNIWSHFIGCGIFICLLVLVLMNDLGDDPTVPKWPLIVHLIAYALMMGASSYYHLFMCVSIETQVRLLNFDYTGIGVSIFGTITSMFYYGYWCEEFLFYRHLWLGIVWTASLIGIIWA